MSETLKTKENFAAMAYDHIVELEAELSKVETMIKASKDPSSNKVFETAKIVADSMRKDLGKNLAIDYQRTFHPRPKDKEEKDETK